MSGQDASTGVQALIDRLRDQGVAAGREQAAQIVAQAREEAADLVAAAREEAQQLLAEARAESARVRESGKAAVALAARDAQLQLREELVTRFSSRIRHLVREALDDRETLHRLVLAVAGRVAGDEIGEASVDVVLPSRVTDLDDLKRDPDGAGADALTQLVRGVTADLLREGVALRTGSHRSGLVVAIRDAGITVDLTDEAVTDLLMRHLRPRFRALLEGSVR